MNQTPDELESDWIHAVFDVLRDEVISIAADFGARVKEQIDQVAATTDLRPPSAAALLGAVAIETTNMATSLLPGAKAPDPDNDDNEGNHDA